MKYSSTPTDMRKKAISLLEKIEGHPKIFVNRKESGLDLAYKKILRERQVGSQSGYQVRLSNKRVLPGIGNRRVHCFRSENDDSLVLRSQAGNLVVPKLVFEKSLENREFLGFRTFEGSLEDRVKSLKNRFKQLSFNFEPGFARRLKKKSHSPSLLERKVVPSYEKKVLSPLQNSLLLKWKERFSESP
jgi:hypothetical protein